MEPYFIRVELWAGTPGDVRYPDDGKPYRDEEQSTCLMEHMELLTWNDFEFEHQMNSEGTNNPEGTVFFDASEATQWALKGWAQKFGGGIRFPRGETA